MRWPTANQSRTGLVLAFVGAGATAFGIAQIGNELLDVRSCGFVAVGLLVLVAGLVIHGIARSEE